MDQEGQRVAPRRVEVDRLDQVAPDRLAVPAGEGELLVVAEADRRQPLAVDLGDAALVGAVEGGGVEVDRALQVVLAVDQPLAGHRRRAHVAAAHQRPRRAGRGVDREQLDLAALASGGVDRAAVGREDDAARRAVPALGQHPRLALRPAAQHDAEAVGLEARAGHRQIGQGAAVGREDRPGVPGLVGLGQAAGLGRAVEGDVPEVEVGRPGLAVAGHPGGEDQTLAVGREGDLLRPAERLRGHVGVEARGQVVQVAAVLVARRHDEQVRAPAVLPAVPVAHEQPVVGAPGGLALGLPGEPIGGALDHRVAVTVLVPLGVPRQRAVGKDLEGEGQVLAVGRDHQVADVERQLAHRPRLAAGRVDAPDLRRARAGRQEEDRLTVRRPAWAGIALLVGGQLAQPRAVDPDQPQIGAAAVGLEIGHPADEDDRLAVGRHLRVRQPVHGDQVVDVERVAVAVGQDRRGEQAGEGEDAGLTHQELSRRDRG